MKTKSRSSPLSFVPYTLRTIYYCDIEYEMQKVVVRPLHNGILKGAVTQILISCAFQRNLS